MAPKNKPLKKVIHTSDNIIKHNVLKTGTEPRAKQQKSKIQKKTSNLPKRQKKLKPDNENPFVNSNLPYHGFCYTGGDYDYRRMLHLMERKNNCKYYSDKRPLDLLPFLYDQPEGMPCWIWRLDDIVNMSEENALVFLRGYGEPTEGANLDELRRRLAIAVGVPESIANKKFHYVDETLESLKKAENEDDEDPFVISNLPYHGFCYTGGDYDYRRMLHLMERKNNCKYYSDKRPLDLLPFLYDQPEDMPCWIWRLDDIVNMSEENALNALVFLRGYGEPTEGANLDELRRRLAIAVGVPERIANKKFNYVDEEGSEFLEKKYENDEDVENHKHTIDFKII